MSDLISRQAVMDTTKAVMKDVLDSLPTRLEDGEEVYDVRTSELDFILNTNKALQNAIKALPSETHEIRTETHGVRLDELISRQAVIDALKNISDPYVPHPGNDIYWCVKAIEELSSVEPVGNSEQLDRTCAKCKFYTADGICVQWSRYGFREDDYCSRWKERDE